MIKSRLKVRMVEREMTVAELSRRTGLSPKVISFLRNNKLSRYTNLVLDKLCQALNCQVGDILEYIPNVQAKIPQTKGNP